MKCGQISLRTLEDLIALSLVAIYAAQTRPPKIVTLNSTPAHAQAATIAPESVPDQCPGFRSGDDRRSVSFNCTLYLADEAGNLVTKSMPNGQLLDPQHNKCDRGYHVTCVQTGCPGFQENNPDECHTCEGDKIVVNTCPKGKNFDVRSLTCAGDDRAVSARKEGMKQLDVGSVHKHGYSVELK